MKKKKENISELFSKVTECDNEGNVFVRWCPAGKQTIESIDIGKGTDFWIGNVYVHCTKPLSEILSNIDKK
jgi:hypothetical protein